MNEKITDPAGIKGQYKVTRYKAGTNEVINQSDWIKNLVVANNGSGVNIIARQLAGNTEYPIEITGCKIGIGTTPVDITDTDLENDVTGFIARASVSYSSAGIEIGFFIPNAFLPDNDYTEFGIFTGNGSTNHLFARSIINPAYSKDGLEDIKVDYQINILTN